MKKILFILFGLLAVIGCSEDDSITGPDVTDPGDYIETVDNGDGTFTTVVDAGYMDATEFVYFSFTEGEVEVADSMVETNWDLGFKFFSIYLNGGTHGTAGVEIAYVDGVDFADVTEAPAEGWITDVDDDGAFKADGGWYTYNPQTHGFSLNERVWFVHLADGTMLKLSFVSFEVEAGSIAFPGFIWEIL
jgi:hypothetical protein